MDKRNQDLILKIGIAVGAYFFIAKPILQKLGILKSKEQKIIDDYLSAPAKDNPFSPIFYTLPRPATTLLTSAKAIQLADRLYNAFGYFSDDEAAVYSVFRELKNQCQVSFLSDYFSRKYKTDLLTFMVQGKGQLPQSGLSAPELNIVIDIVKNLPRY